jgi:hypothetical protein
MEAKQIVVPSSECDYKELCRQLREVLGNLHYSTNKCVACGWIASDDDNWEKCTECGNSICQSCWDEARQEAGEEARDDEWPVLCEGCYEEGGSENPTTEACGCVETEDGWLCDGCGHWRPYSSDSASLVLRDIAPRVSPSVAAIEVVLEFAGGEVEAQIVANGDEPKLDDRPVVAMTVRTTVRTTRTSAMGTQ